MLNNEPVSAVQGTQFAIIIKHDEARLVQTTIIMLGLDANHLWNLDFSSARELKLNFVQV